MLLTGLALAPIQLIRTANFLRQGHILKLLNESRSNPHLCG